MAGKLNGIAHLKKANGDELVSVMKEGELDGIGIRK